MAPPLGGAACNDNPPGFYQYDTNGGTNGTSSGTPTRVMVRKGDESAPTPEPVVPDLPKAVAADALGVHAGAAHEQIRCGRSGRAYDDVVGEQDPGGHESVGAREIENAVGEHGCITGRVAEHRDSVATAAVFELVSTHLAIGLGRLTDGFRRCCGFWRFQALFQGFSLVFGRVPHHLRP